MERTVNRAAAWVVALALAAGAAGCASWSGTEKGAVIGAATGAAVGGAIGSNSGNTATGAIIGAAVGGAAGALIGHQMDRQADELRQDIPGAKVERVGEGIKVTFDSGLLFDFDSDVIKGAAKANLENLALNLNKYKESNLLIVGHTDDVGKDDYNMSLSERRASAAARYLASKGVTRPIQTLGRGEREPVASNDTEAGRAQNRRVELAIYANQAMVDKAKQDAAKG